MLSSGAASSQGGGFVSYPVFESLRRLTAVGLPVIVELRMMNPLDLRIELSNLRLFGALLPHTATQEAAASGGPRTRDPENIIFSTVDVELEPTASATIRLTATPLKPGRLHLQGETETAITQIQSSCIPPVIPSASGHDKGSCICSAVAAVRFFYFFCCAGVVGKLFKLVQVSQYFCLHGAQRAERRFDLRHCHLDWDPEEDAVAEDVEGSPYRLQQRLSMIRQMLTAPQTPEVKTQLSRLLRGLPLFYALHVEGFRLLHTGTPVQVCI